MIFLSHNSKDKPVVDQFAIRLSEKYGKEEVFYDSWSIKPGDSIIGTMDFGLSRTDTFVLFVSENSLRSGMVTMEWQTALTERAGGNMTLIPVRMDESEMPMLLSQIKYIDLYTNGLEVALRQLDDVLENEDSFLPHEFHNLEAQVRRTGADEIDVTVRATAFQEPISRFFIAFDSDVSQMGISVDGEAMFNSGDSDLTAPDGTIIKSKFVGIARAITPSFPMKIRMSNANAANVIGVFQPSGSETTDLKVVPIIHLG